MRKKAKLWHIYFARNCNHVKPLPKDKFVVIVHIDKNPMGFLVNSHISNWLRKRPHLLACEASISSDEHSCLKHDSFVDCHSIYAFFDWELTSERGEVSHRAKINILKAIRDCPTIERKYKEAILNRDGELLEDQEQSSES
jgi:hypothetical protein